MPCWGKFALISRRIIAAAARSASVAGSNSGPAVVFSTESEVRKNGRMVSPEDVARRPMKAEKSMTVTDYSLRARGRELRHCLERDDAWMNRHRAGCVVERR